MSNMGTTPDTMGSPTYQNESFIDEADTLSSTPYTIPHRMVVPCQDHENYCQYRIWLDVFCVGFITLFGLLGNSLSFIVLQRDSSRRVAFLLQALAVADNFYLITTFMLFPAKAVCDCTDWIENFKFTYPPNGMIASESLNISILILDEIWVVLIYWITTSNIFFSLFQKFRYGHYLRLHRWRHYGFLS